MSDRLKNFLLAVYWSREPDHLSSEGVLFEKRQFSVASLEVIKPPRIKLCRSDQVLLAAEHRADSPACQTVRASENSPLPQLTGLSGKHSQTGCLRNLRHDAAPKVCPGYATVSPSSRLSIAVRFDVRLRSVGPGLSAAGKADHGRSVKDRPQAPGWRPQRADTKRSRP